TGRKIAEHHFIESIGAVRFSQDGHRLFATVSDGNVAVAGKEGGLAVLDAMTGGIILSFFDARPNVRRQHWEINRDGTRLLETQTLRLLVDAQTGTALARSPAAYMDD